MTRKKPLTVALSGTCTLGVRGSATPATSAPISGQAQLKISTRSDPTGIEPVVLFGPPGDLRTETAIANQAHKEKSRRGGLAKPFVPWHARALQLESKIRDEQNEGLSQSAVERQILKQWKEPPAKPSPESLKLFLREEKRANR
jgi:hypothetical protein